MDLSRNGQLSDTSNRKEQQSNNQAPSSSAGQASIGGTESSELAVSLCASQTEVKVDSPPKPKVVFCSKECMWSFSMRLSDGN